MELKSTIFDFLNNILEKIQGTKLSKFVSESFIFNNIDNLIFLILCLLLLVSTFLSTGVIGFLAILIVVLSVLKLIFLKDEKIKLSKMDSWIILYYMIVVLSLCASTNFSLSFHGFLKMFTYWAFYFSVSGFLRGNKRRVLPVIFLIATLCSIQSVIGIVQNSLGVMEISTWQDVSNLDVTEVLSRCYGTLSPYNPNLLAGYLIACVPCVFSVSLLYLFKKHYKRACFSFIFLFINILAIFYTGCRGAYLALFAMAVVAFIAFYKYTNGFSTIKKRYKTLLTTFITGFFCVLIAMPPIYKRILSIFAMRGDSSTSFRMNVYQAGIKMFLDNPFLGIGVGNQNFREVYGLYMKTGFDALGAYSVPLEIAIESGIFALISFVMFLLCAIRRIIFLLKNPRNIVKSILLLSVLLTITGCMVHGTFDTVFFRPQIQVIFWLNIAILNLFFI